MVERITNSRAILLAGGFGACVGGILEFLLPWAIGTATVGPTAEAMDTASWFVLGAGIGVAAGATAGAILGHTAHFLVRFEQGFWSGYVAAGLGVVPAILIAEHGNLLPTLAGLLACAFFAAPVSGVGALIGIGVTRFGERAFA